MAGAFATSRAARGFDSHPARPTREVTIRRKEGTVAAQQDRQERGLLSEVTGGRARAEAKVFAYGTEFEMTARDLEGECARLRPWHARSGDIGSSPGQGKKHRQGVAGALRR